MSQQPVPAEIKVDVDVEGKLGVCRLYANTSRDIYIDFEVFHIRTSKG